MDKQMIETVASAMQRQYGKAMFGETQKWEKLPPSERSTWRLVARVAVSLIQDPPAQRPANKARPVRA